LDHDPRLACGQKEKKNQKPHETLSEKIKLKLKKKKSLEAWPRW
jgi:hypothetical protein